MKRIHNEIRKLWIKETGFDIYLPIDIEGNVYQDFEKIDNNHIYTPYNVTWGISYNSRILILRNMSQIEIFNKKIAEGLKPSEALFEAGRIYHSEIRQSIMLNLTSYSHSLIKSSFYMMIRAIYWNAFDEDKIEIMNYIISGRPDPINIQDTLDKLLSMIPEEKSPV